MFKHFKRGIANYANFYGRASRKEFWMFALTYFLLSFGILILAGLVWGLGAQILGGLVAFIGIIFLLAFMVPMFTITWRRVQDVGQPGSYCFLAATPFVGGIIIIVYGCLKGDEGRNKYGHDPKQRLASS